MVKCIECKYCKQKGRTLPSFKSFGRKKYYCDNSNARLIIDGVLPKHNCFIAFGEDTRDSLLQLKTSPRWCPLRNNKNE